MREPTSVQDVHLHYIPVQGLMKAETVWAVTYVPIGDPGHGMV